MHPHDEQPDSAKLPEDLRALDAELADALRVEAPRELIERIEVATGVYDPSLEAAIRREVGVQLPADVADEIAGAVGLADVELDRELRAALAAGPAPAGLTDRIASATAGPAAPIVGRIGFALVWRGAIAAALVAAVTLALYWASGNAGPDDTVDPTPIVTADDLAELEQQIAAALESEPPAPVLDEELDSLTAEVDALAVTLAFGSQDDPLDAYTDQIEDELDLIEQHLGSF